MFPEFEEYIDMLKIDKSVNTVATYSRSLKKFFTDLGVSTIAEIGYLTVANIREWRDGIVNSVKGESNDIVNKKMGTANTHLRNIKVFFNWLQSEGYIDNNVSTKVKYLKTKREMKTFLTEEEILSLINSSKRLQDKLMIALMISTGMRRSEIVNINLQDITIDNDVCHILIHGKGNKERILALQPDVFALLKSYMVKRQKKYGDIQIQSLFVSRYKNKLYPNAVRDTVIRVCKAAGVDPERMNKISPHTLRRTFCTNLIDAGVNMKTVQMLMGHDKMETTLLYAGVRNTTLDNVLLSQKPIVRTK